MPDLIVIAGCNGAGKLTFAPSFLTEGISSFDYDKLFLENYHSLPDSELREKFAKDKTTEMFENSVHEAILNNNDFCYETNFDTHPISWPKKFRSNGYQIKLIFFCIENQEIARHRIQVRTEFSGHFVDDKTIDFKWKAGYKNVNSNFEFFDEIIFVDNSEQNSLYTNILQIRKDDVVLMTDSIHYYFQHRLPDN